MAVKTKINIDKEKLKAPIIKDILWCGGFFILGLMLSLGSLIGSIRPFGISIVSVAKKKHLPFALAGAVVGYLTGGLNEQTARYIAALLIAAIGALAADIFDLRHSISFIMTVAFLANVSTGLILNIHESSELNEYLITVASAILSSGGVFFFYNSLNSSYKRLRLKALPISEICCITISLSIILINLSSIHIFSVVPVRILAYLLILTSIQYNNQKWAMLLSVTIGFALSIAQEGAIFIVGALCVATMLASLFNAYSIYAGGVCFVTVMTLFSLAGGNEFLSPIFIESLISIAILFLLPERINQKLEAFWTDENTDIQNKSLRQSLVLKLRFASSAMAAISESVDQVREKINTIIRDENSRKKPFISEEEYLRNEIILEKTNQLRMVASDQFFSISDMLEDLAFEFDEAETFNSNATIKIRRCLGDYGIFPKNVTAIEDKYNRIRVDVLVDSDTKNLYNKKLNSEIGKICDRYFEQGKITYFKDEAMLSYFERPNYKLRIGFAQHGIAKLCGDTVKAINDNKGHTILVISDGMGTGSRAALDGAMGAGLISKLINAGFGFDSALKVVNSALLVKSNDESLATLDIANIDLFTGKCVLLKAGAPASYIIKPNEIVKIELTSMPAGILRGIEFAKRSAVLRVKDSIVLLSDGITDLGEEWIRQTLQSLNSTDVQYCADKILEEAIKQSDNNPKDDMSVIYATLDRN